MASMDNKEDELEEKTITDNQRGSGLDRPVEIHASLNMPSVVEHDRNKIMQVSFNEFSPIRMSQVRENQQSGTSRYRNELNSVRQSRAQKSTRNSKKGLA